MLDSISRVLEDSARGGFYLTLGSIFSGAVSAASLVIIARALGSEQYGLYTISTIIPSLLIMFVDPGINQGIMKFSANLRARDDGKRLRKLLLHSLSFEIILGLTVSIACFALSDQLANYILNRPDIGGLIRMASTLIIFQTIITTINSAFIGLDKTEYNTLTTVVQATAKAVIALVLLILGFGIIGALMGYVASIALACLLGILLLTFRIYRPLDHSNGDPESFSNDLKMLMGYGLPLYASVLIGGLTLQYRSILLSVFTSNYEVGNFQAAMNFNAIMNSISIPVATMLLPAFSKMEERKEMTKELFRMSLKYTAIVLLPITILLMVYAEEAVRIIYGAGYELAPSLLILIMVAYFLVGLGSNTLGSFFGGIGETRINLKITIVSSITLIVLAPLFGYSLKINGIILTLLISSLTGTIYGLHIARKSFEIKIDPEKMIRIYLVSLVSALPILAVKELLAYSDIVMVMLGMAIYFASYLLMIPLTGVMTRTELKEIEKIVEKITLLNYLSKPILYCEERIFEAFPRTSLAE